MSTQYFSKKEWILAGPEWDTRFGELLDFRERFGHVRCPDSHAAAPLLPKWLAVQRSHLDDLSLGQIQRLWETGVRFIPKRHNQWLFRFFQLVEGKATFGTARDPRIWKNDKSLHNWVEVQRDQRNKLSAYRRRLLEEIGFEWNLTEAAWEKRFAQWKDHVRRTGSPGFPGKLRYSTLAQWSRQQRIRRKRGLLDPDRIRRLTAAGFPWTPKEDMWEARFIQFARFWRKHGRIPRRGEDARLAMWCWDTVRDHKEGRLWAERAARMEALGFQWDFDAAFWEAKHEKLRLFHARHGHSRVPEKWPEDPRLVNWIRQQRYLRRKGRLSTERIARLDEVDLVWEPMRKS